MNKLHTLGAVAALATTLALAGCWNDDDDEPVVAVPTPSTDVPDSAAASTASFFSYLLGLNSSDESSQPLTLKDSFAVPADESAEPSVLP